jgi:hypothetical protein
LNKVSLLKPILVCYFVARHHAAQVQHQIPTLSHGDLPVKNQGTSNAVRTGPRRAPAGTGPTQPHVNRRTIVKNKEIQHSEETKKKLSEKKNKKKEERCPGFPGSHIKRCPGFSRPMIESCSHIEPHAAILSCTAQQQPTRPRHDGAPGTRRRRHQDADRSRKCDVLIFIFTIVFFLNVYLD